MILDDKNQDEINHIDQFFDPLLKEMEISE